MPADDHVSAEPENETEQITNCDPSPKDLPDVPNELGVEGNSGEKEDFPLHCKGSVAPRLNSFCTWEIA